MATFTSIVMAVTLLVAASSAAPNTKLSLKIPDACKGKGFCTIKPEGYDEMQKMINSLLTPSFIQTMGDRIGDEDKTKKQLSDNDGHNCPYRRTPVEPYTYHHSNDSYHIIAQTDQFKQVFDEVTCAWNDKISINSSEMCFKFAKLSLFNMKTSCESSTAKRSLILYDKEHNKLKMGSFNVPCCCSCIITKSG